MSSCLKIERSYDTESEARVMALLRHASHFNPEKLKVNIFVLGLNNNMHGKVYCLMPQTFHDFVPRAVVQDEFNFTGMASEAKQKVGGRGYGRCP